METPKNSFLTTVLSALLRPLIHHLDKAALPRYQGDLALSGLRERVKIFWQPHAIPHVFAADEHDLFFAQGYLHAQERLWQMEIGRRFLSGRMAEIFGSFPVPWKELTSHFRGTTSVDFDYFMLLLGIRRSAMLSLELLPEDHRQRLEAYSLGVNRYIEQCGKKLPWEFRLLRIEPEVWQPADSLTLAKGFAFLLSTSLVTRLNMIAVAAKLDGQPEKLCSLYPTYPEKGPTITRALWDAARAAWQFTSGVFAGSDWYPSGHGSNGWVIAARRSTTNYPILCNDPHLRMTLPSTWYLMHLKVESPPFAPDGYEAWGASIPGCPCIQLGHNRRIAWGVTAALCDDVELYREKLHPVETERYLVGDEWHRLKSREEIIHVRGKKFVAKIIRFTRHGPVISDFHAERSMSEVLALRWTAHDPSQEFRCLYGVNRAQNWHEFLESLSYQAAPTLNYIYADRDGNIGYSLAGKVPLRPSVPTLLPPEGWRNENEWQGYVPFSDLPRLYNPPEGAIATANQRIADTAYPYYLSQFFEPPYRIQRIGELLKSRDRLSQEDMEAMQKDSVSLHARALVEALNSDLSRAFAENSLAAAAAHRLLGWNGQCDETSVESAIFHVFHQRLLANLLLTDLGEELFTAQVEIFNQCLIPVDEILKNSHSPWFAKQSRKSLVFKSLTETCDHLERAFGGNIENWTWGRLHTLTLDHALGRVKFLRPLVSIGPFPSAGDGTTLNMGFYRHSDPYRHTVGPSLRFIINLGHLGESRFIVSSGQSGHLGSPYYHDLTTLWRRGEYLRFIGIDERTKDLPLLSLVPTTRTPTEKVG
jgi:penicillin amidase